MPERLLQSVDLEVENTTDEIATAILTLTVGRLVMIGHLSFEGETLFCRGAHIHGEGVPPNGLGPGSLKRIATEVMEEFDVDRIVVEGGRRTTGARPGTLPRPLRFARATATGAG